MILRVEDEAGLQPLMDLRHYLSRGRIVIVYSGNGDREPANLHRLNARFIGHEELDLLALYQVLGRMMEAMGAADMREGHQE